MPRIKGLVSLVGSGPGDPELLTLKAQKRLHDADLIVYDYLANPEHLRHAKSSARCIGVGKGFRHKKMSQEKINRLILQASRQGRRVVRLKGGDPYLFGRGGEEALYLASHGVPFEVVPGVTSATACAAYAGIPLTHREHNSSVVFLTGHRADDKNLDTVEWHRIAGLAKDGTLVIYMGFYNLGRIARQLIAFGLAPDTRVAVIEWGTLPRQRSCEGTLRDIESKVRAKSFEPPCLIIIGEVVGLRGKLDWYERLPLFGKTVVLTRPAEKNAALARELAEAGARVLEMPVIEIRSVKDFSAMDGALKRLGDFDWAIFTSSYGVEAVFRRLESKGRDARYLGKLKIASVGTGTSTALKRRGVKPDLEPARYETSALVEAFQKRKKETSGKKMVLFRTDIAPPLLEKGLRRLGAEVLRVTAYRTLRCKVSKDLRRQVLSGKADFVTFTSASTVRHFKGLIGARRARGLKSKFVSIGPVTSREMRREGFRVSAEARIFNAEGLVKALKECR